MKISNIAYNLLLGLLFSLVWFCVYKTVVIIYSFIKLNHIKKTTPALIKTELENSCKVHNWINITLVMSQIPVDKYNVCYNCGSVSGTDYSLNQSGLDSMREKIEIKEKEDKIKQDINEEVKRRILEHKKSTLAETVSKLDKNEDKLKLLADMYDKVLEAKNDITGKVFSEKLPDMRD